MSVTIETLIDRLSVPERLELIERIWDTLPPSLTREEVPEWHRMELARRRSEADAQPGEGRPWRDVLGIKEAKP
ncbi:MAG: addiction module protein [Gemmataceae bacterium]